ncbi:MAG: arginine-tRNA-protein transferase [Acidobacteria bacterium]|nr:arginine-tRNA-protein transferase [Acidobacteriota bacterium]MCW5948066.1 hypothetical protein [Pyrinomonadaceae bacterium]
MRDSAVPSVINEAFIAGSVTREQVDLLLSEGWRHFGTYFFRYNFGMHDDSVVRVLPLRIRLSQYRPTRSQRRVLRINSDLAVKIRPIRITEASNALFERHKTRFASGTPESIYTFLSAEPATVPCDGSEIAVYDGRRLVAVSYFDEGAEATSGVYACFEPAESKRGLGIFTMLKEIEYSIDTGREFYYPGFAYEESSFYDYKKTFNGLERYDWNGNWLELERLRPVNISS